MSAITQYIDKVRNEARFVGTLDSRKQQQSFIFDFVVLVSAMPARWVFMYGGKRYDIHEGDDLYVDTHNIYIVNHDKCVTIKRNLLL